jgi:hypothetical protein
LPVVIQAGIFIADITLTTGLPVYSGYINENTSGDQAET